MKKSALILIATFLVLPMVAQTTVSKLSSKAANGYLYSTDIVGEDLVVTYKMPVKKKSKEAVYEHYTFDKAMGFKGSTTSSEPIKKEVNQDMPDREVGVVAAYVGGNNSFNVNSMKLKIDHEIWEQTYNSEKGKYVFTKRVNSSTIKPKKDVERYMGHADYQQKDLTLIIASYEAPNKKDGNLFNMLVVTVDGDIEEVPITTTPGYSLVYSNKLSNDNICMVLAPAAGNQYLYKEFTPRGKEFKDITFQAPSPNTLVFDHAENNGDIYLVGLSRNLVDNYTKVFTDYAPIYNPGYTGWANYQQSKFEKRAFDKEAENIHIIKLGNASLAFSSTNPIKDFASKLKTPPKQKKGSPYKGKRFEMQKSYVSPNGDLFLVGQIIKKSVSSGILLTHYLDIVCFQFDAKGNLRAQYAVDKLINDKKSKMFASLYNFVPSADNNTVYWEVLEVKGAKGYRDFYNAMNGIPTFYAHYFPRISKINVKDATISDFDVIGNAKGDYLLYNSKTAIIGDPSSKTRYYISRDKNFKNLAVSKYQML